MGSGWMKDVRYAWRGLRMAPGFTLVAVLTLALGIGANTAIFSVVHAVLLKPLPFPHAEQLVELWETEVAPGNYPLSDQDFLDWKAQNRTFQDMALYGYPMPTNVSGGGAVEQVPVVVTSANFFDVLGVHPVMGRGFAAGEDIQGRNRIALLSWGFWNSHFGGRPAAIGETLQLNGENYSVIGVMPAWFTAPATAAVWTPRDASPDKVRGRSSHYLDAIGRMKEGVSIEQARADLKGIAARSEKEFPKTNKNETAILVPLHTDMVGDSGKALWIAFGAVGLVLLIACANFANLLLARSLGRRREMALRGAIGASRWMLVRQLLTESVLLAVAGGVAGAFLAYGGVELLKSLSGIQVTSANPVGLDWVVLGFCFVVSVAVGVVFGLAPAFQASRVNLIEALKTRTGTSGGAGRAWMRDALVAAEVGLSLALLVGAGLLLRTFANLRGVDVGVRRDHVLMGMILLPEKNYKTLDQQVAFSRELLEKIKNSPGIQDAAFASVPALFSGSNGYITVDGQPEVVGYSGPLVTENQITPDYFRTMGIPMLEGRELTEEDEQVAAEAQKDLVPYILANDQEGAKKEAAKTVNAAVISKRTAQEFWPGQDALGKIYRSGSQPMRVVGVVADVKNAGLRSVPMCAAYEPLGLSLGFPGGNFLYLSALTAGKPEAAEKEIRAALGSIDGTLALSEVKTMPRLLSDYMADTNDEALLLSVLAGLAVLLAAVGTYGVMSYVVSQRTNEIGIRMALGAQRENVMNMVMGQGGALIGVGVVGGLVLAAVGARLMKDLLFGVASFDVATYGGVAVMLALVGALACAVPAGRAMRVSPMEALREE
jgi:predicted permease